MLEEDRVVDWSKYNRNFAIENRTLLNIITQLVKQLGGKAKVSKFLAATDNPNVLISENALDLTWNIEVRDEALR